MFFSVIERLGLKKLLDKSKIISTAYCFLIVNFGWVFFRSNGILNGIKYITRMVAPWRDTGLQPIISWNYLNRQTLIKAIVPKQVTEKWKDSVLEAIYIFILLILCMAAMASDTYNPFIYFQF